MFKQDFVLVSVVLLAVTLSGCSGSSEPDGRPSMWVISRDIGPLIVSFTNADFIDESFVVKNPSSDTEMFLELKNRSCQCLHFSVDPLHVPAGGETKITVRASLTPAIKENYLTLLFGTGLPESPWLQLRLRVKTIPSLDILPQELPLVSLSAVEEKTVLFDVVGNQKLTEPRFSLEVTSIENAIQTEILEQSVDETPEVRSLRARCEVRIPGTEPYDVAQGGMARIQARLGEQKLVRELRWNRVWPIKIEPREVFFSVHPSAKSTKDIYLRGERPFSIVSSALDSDFLQMNVPLNVPALSHICRIETTPLRSLAGAERATVVLRTDDPVQSELRVPVHLLSNSIGPPLRL